VPCPNDIGDQAIAWWQNWATSPYARIFDKPAWQELADCARLMNHFYERHSLSAMVEVRHRTKDVFGLVPHRLLVLVPMENGSGVKFRKDGSPDLRKTAV
jgi:hypothetical protein